MILVVCAVAAELGRFERKGVDVVAVGVGPVEAAIGTARALCARPYEFAINAGIAGGFAGRAAVGDAIAVTQDRYVELGREDRAELTLPGGLRLVDLVASDAPLLARLEAAISPAPVRSATAITSATITTSAARADELAALYAPSVESMEGFAVLRTAVTAGVRAIELRGISNIVGDRATSQWDFRSGSTAVVRALNLFLDLAEVRA